MVAPSFKEFTVVREQYIKNGKYYVDVKNPKTGTVRSVRWYTDAEFAKNYGKKFEENEDKGWDGLKHARGFDNGPILVIRGARSTDEKWLKASCARYAVGIGWYIVSTNTFPDDAPKHLKYLLLSWEEFRDGDDRHMKKPAQLAEILSQKAINKEWFKING